MWINFVLTLYAVHIFIQQCCGIHFIELPGFQSDDDTKDPPTEKSKEKHKSHDEKNDWIGNDQSSPKLRSHDDKKQANRDKSDGVRRYWLVSKPTTAHTDNPTTESCDKDAKLKEKISRLVYQTVHDTEQKLHSVEKLKDKHRDENPYKIGFILSMVKKSNDMLNELFNMAVKHRHEWKALEQMKTFESIVHTNVDTTHLVRQLVEIHIQHINSTKSDDTASKRRVVLL